MLKLSNNNTGKNPTYAQGKIKVFTHNIVYCVKAVFCCLQVELENKENYNMVDFSATNILYLLNRYNHMNSRNDR